jgi:hypothetical protein
MLGCTLKSTGTVGTDGIIDVDVNGWTRIPGLYAVGDMAHPLHWVSLAIAHGASAGMPSATSYSKKISYTEVVLQKILRSENGASNYCTRIIYCREKVNVLHLFLVRDVHVPSIC